MRIRSELFPPVWVTVAVQPSVRVPAGELLRAQQPAAWRHGSQELSQPSSDPAKSILGF